MHLLRFAPLAFAALIGPALAARDAHAEPPPPRVLDVSAVPKAPETEHVWYGWETMLVDIGSITVLMASARNESPVGLGVGLGGYAFGGPLVHLANGEPGRAGVSFAVRVLLPIAAGAMGYALDTSSSSGKDDVGPAIGTVLFGFLGALGAVVLDAAAVAHKDVPVEKPGLSVKPQLAFGPHGSVHAGVGGTF